MVVREGNSPSSIDYRSIALLLSYRTKNRKQMPCIPKVDEAEGLEPSILRVRVGCITIMLYLSGAQGEI